MDIKFRQTQTLGLSVTTHKGIMPALEIHLGSRQLPRVLPRYSVFIVITWAKILKILRRWLFPSKIYIQFTIFNTCFSTKLSFTNKRYYLHVLEECLYVLQEVRSIIYFGSLFILFLFVHVTVEQTLLSGLISSYRRNSVTSHF